MTLYVNGNFPSFSVEITNRQTNEVVSRGYNLLAEKYYKTAANVMGKELCVTISYESTAARSVPEIVLGSTDSPQAEFKEPSSDIMTQSVDISGSEIPKNVDGNQGKVIGSYTTVGVTSTAGHTILASKFYSTTDNMTSINLGWQSADGNYDDLGYTLNLLKGRSFKSYSIPVNYDVELRASTNSSSGSQATIRVSERAY